MITKSLRKLIQAYVFFLILMLNNACSGDKQPPLENHTAKKDTLVISTDTIKSVSKIAIKMDSIAGVYQVPCYVNGVKMNFIFDTGASSVCISLTEALFLAKNGYLDKEDIIGQNRMMIADGSLVENMEVNLRSIDIAGILLTDVKATIVSSLNAPLLLGQTALKRLGKIEIDGDSLFITPKDGKISKTDINAKESVDTQPVFKQIEKKWYDKPLALLGYEGKIMEYLNAARIAAYNNMPEQAIAYCNEALKIKKSFKAYAIKGRIYYWQYGLVRDGSDKGNEYRDKGIKSLEKYLKYNTEKEDFTMNDDTIFYTATSNKLGWLYIYKDSIDRALELGQQVYQRNPQSPNAMMIISCAYTKQGNYVLAEKWAKKLLNSGLDNSSAYFRLARLAEKQKQHKEAVHYYEKCLEIDSEDTCALNNLGIIYYYDLENEDYAIYLWKKAARLGDAYSQRKLRKLDVEW